MLTMKRPTLKQARPFFSEAPRAKVAKQWRLSEIHGFWAKSEIVAIVGFMPVRDAGRVVLELWFACSKALASHLAPFVRAVRRILSGMDSPVLAEIETEAGARLARLVGLKPRHGMTWGVN
jgi:hypothetical protein